MDSQADGTDASNHRVFVVSRNAGLNVRILDAAMVQMLVH
jgi:hypothetical protein